MTPFLFGVGVAVGLIAATALVGALFATVKGDPPAYRPPADDRADWPDASLN